MTASEPHPFLASLSTRLSNIHLPEFSLDPRETHEPQDPVELSQLIYERLDEVKARERRSILRVLRRFCCICAPNLDDEYAPLSSNDVEKEESILDLLASQFSNKPIVDPSGLSIIERVFYKSAPDKPQVIMCLTIHCTLPPSVEALSADRIIDLIRIAQAKHFRLSSYVDPTTLNVIPLAQTADKLPLNFRFILKPRTNGSNLWKDVYMEEINTNFNLADTQRPLWRAAIVAPQSMMPIHSSTLIHEQSHLRSSSNIPRNNNRRLGKSTESFGEILPNLEEKERTFSIVFSFHHCLGDGLSMFAFCRTFAECCDVDYLSAADLRLDEVRVVQEPPPLLDNVLSPSIFEVLPTALMIGFKSLLRRSKTTFAPFKIKTKRRAIIASSSEGVTPQLSAPGSPIPHPSTIPSSPNQRDTVIHLLPHGISSSSSSARYKPSTNVRFLWFNDIFTTSLRARARENDTSIASVIVVAALTATLAVLKTRPQHIASLGGTCPLPTHQGWVVTNSNRHLLPQSRLMKGGDRESDPALKIFGGYAGSVTNNSLKISEESNVWSRCRSVKKTIATCGWASLKRMKLVNYCYRHPKLWRMIEARAKSDLSKMSRTFSVEVANLGAWENPLASSNGTTFDDSRLRLEYFAGVMNSSFDGVRGLFTLGVITLGGNMSVAVAHDTSCVTEVENEVFTKVFCEAMRRLDSATNSSITVNDLLSGR
ncbi:hypothetical protein BC830DRAFT_930440 [Chytriomyces sp. MP71]|nr:hypothetical protein BC830DRAFT_930440 [Chytriomyces sp. MP71]